MRNVLLVVRAASLVAGCLIVMWGVRLSFLVYVIAHNYEAYFPLPFYGLAFVLIAVGVPSVVGLIFAVATAVLLFVQLGIAILDFVWVVRTFGLPAQWGPFPNLLYIDYAQDSFEYYVGSFLCLAAVSGLLWLLFAKFRGYFRQTEMSDMV